MANHIGVADSGCSFSQENQTEFCHDDGEEGFDALAFELEDSILLLGNGNLGTALLGELKAQGFENVKSIKINYQGQQGKPEAKTKAPTLMTEEKNGFHGNWDETLESPNLLDLCKLLYQKKMVIAAFEDTPFSSFLELDRACHEMGVPMVSLTGWDQSVILGPLTVPGVTASFQDAYQEFLKFLNSKEDYELSIAEHESQSVEVSLAQKAAQELVSELKMTFCPKPDTTLFSHLEEITLKTEARRKAKVIPISDRYKGTEKKVEKIWPSLVVAAALRLAVADNICTSHRSDKQIPSDDSAYQSVCIVGGGTAGYLTALALRRRLPHLEVVLVESSKVPVIGVGEATTPSLPVLLHGILGFDINDFFKKVSPTFKLGIQFDWGLPGADYFNYPFGAHGQLLEAQSYDGHIRNYSLSSQLMSADKMPIFKIPGGGYESKLHYGSISFAYHLDNKRFVHYLQDEARKAGVKHIDADIVDAKTAPNGLEVTHLVTEDGKILAYDFYVDCSGFRSLLLEKTMGSKWISFEKSLFTNRAVVAKVPHGGHVKPYTLAESMRHGWCWNTPAPDSDHCGYVYSSSFCSDEEAVREMKLKKPNMGEHRIVSFRSGRHEEFWKGNVVSIGNSFGFVEPLESTGIHMIVEEILTFVGHFPQTKIDLANRRFVNKHITEYWDHLRWFLTLHFRFNQKYKTPFWQACNEDSDISGLEEIIQVYKEGAPLSYRNHFIKGDRLWGDHGRDVMLMGQHVFPRRFLRPRDSQKLWEHKKHLAQLTIKQAVSHQEAIELLGKNPAILEHLAKDETSWIQAVTKVFEKETATYPSIGESYYGVMKKGSHAIEQNVLL